MYKTFFGILTASIVTVLWYTMDDRIAADFTSPALVLLIVDSFCDLLGGS